MSQRFVFDEDNQLPAKIIRAVIWSGCGRFLFLFLSASLPFCPQQVILYWSGCFFSPYLFCSFYALLLAPLSV